MEGGGELFFKRNIDNFVLTEVKLANMVPL